MSYKYITTAFITSLLCALFPLPQAHADENQTRFDGQYEIIPNYVGTNLEYSHDMFDKQNHITDKNIQMLRARKDGTLKPMRLYLGAHATGTIITERSNTDGKFPILSQLPPTHTSGNSDTYGFINDASINATMTLPYVTIFAQGEYTELAYKNQERTQWRKYYATIGDLEKFPVYATIGKKTVNFGNFDSYAPFTHNTSSHYFWSQTNEPLLEVGYVKDGTMIAGSLIKNDRGLRVLNAPENDGSFENFAINVSQEFTINPDTHAKIGAGFLRGTIYDSLLAHHPPSSGLDDRNWNGAGDVNATLSYKNFDIMAEYTRTTDDWPATDYPVSALSTQARAHDTILSRPTTYSIMYSEGTQGDGSDEFQKMRQGVIGIETEIFPHIEIGAEYLINQGFVPLILPRITADDGVVSHTGIIGAKITF